MLFEDDAASEDDAVSEGDALSEGAAVSEGDAAVGSPASAWAADQAAGRTRGFRFAQPLRERTRRVHLTPEPSRHAPLLFTHRSPSEYRSHSERCVIQPAMTRVSEVVSRAPESQGPGCSKPSRSSSGYRSVHRRVAAQSSSPGPSRILFPRLFKTPWIWEFSSPECRWLTLESRHETPRRHSG